MTKARNGKREREMNKMALFTSRKEKRKHSLARTKNGGRDEGERIKFALAIF